MHGNRHTYNISNQYYIFIRMRLVGAFLPFKDKPEDKSRTERRISINLTLYGREPECIAKGISQRTHKSAPQNRNHCFERHLPLPVAVVGNLSRQAGNSPEQQHYGCRAQQTRHEVYAPRHLSRVGCEIGEEPCRNHKDRVSGRVSHLQFISRRDKLSAVPETCGRFERQGVNDGRNKKNRPPEDVVKFFVTYHI